MIKKWHFNSSAALRLSHLQTLWHEWRTDRCHYKCAHLIDRDRLASQNKQNDNKMLNSSAPDLSRTKKQSDFEWVNWSAPLCILSVEYFGVSMYEAASCSLTSFMNKPFRKQYINWCGTIFLSHIQSHVINKHHHFYHFLDVILVGWMTIQLIGK